MAPPVLLPALLLQQRQSPGTLSHACLYLDSGVQFLGFLPKQRGLFDFPTVAFENRESPDGIRQV